MGKKYKSPQGLNYSYLIYPPSGAHKGFRLIKIIKKTNKTETIRSPELEVINDKFIGGELNKLKAREAIERIRENLYEKDGVKKVEIIIHPENKRLLDNYWAQEYVPTLNTLSDPDTARYELERAIEAAGPNSLKTCSKLELQRYVNKVAKGNKQRRVVVKLNSLLRFAKRDFVLTAAKEEKYVIKHITIDDLGLLLDKLPTEEMRLLHAVCFYTGCLIGEVFALDARTYSPGSDTIKIQSQIDRRGKKRDARNHKTRTTVVIPEGRDALLDWFHVRDKVPHELRMKVYRYTQKAALEAFPNRPSKHITFRDLRHSYVVHLLSKGVPIALVAQCIGTDEKTAKKLYGGFGLSEDSIELISRALKSS